VLFAALLFQQRRSRHPLFDSTFFADHRYLRFLAAQGLMFMVIAGHGFALPFYLDRVMGLSHQASGLALGLFPIGVSLAAPLGGHLADRIRPTVVLGVGVAGNVCVTGLFALALHLGASWAVYPYLPVMGVFVGFFLAPSAKLLLTGVSPRNQGMATSLFLTVNNMALAIGVAVSALGLTLRAGSGHAISHTPQTFFLLYALLTAICLAAAGLVLVNHGNRTDSSPAGTSA
jgi:MFS family permease